MDTMPWGQLALACWPLWLAYAAMVAISLPARAWAPLRWVLHHPALVAFWYRWTGR